MAPDSRVSMQRSQGAEQEKGYTTEDSQLDSSSTDNHTSTPQPQICRVTRHIKTERKMIDWNLSVGKRWLIIGDSNLSRIPGYYIPDLQVESYPGANFRHAQALIAKSLRQVPVEKVVLAFGINCRGQRAKETAIKQMQGAVRAAKRQFPYAEIWIPIINYSVFLPHNEQVTIKTLNTHITRNLPYIPPLGSEHFHTDGDHVHWTRGTARAMLEHWVTYLNLNAP